VNNDILPGGEPLLARVRAEAGGATRLRFAPGYLFLSGLAPLWDALEASGAEIHLLIGNTAGQPTEEQRVAEQANGSTIASELDVAAAARAERKRILAETAGALRANLAHIPHTDQNARMLAGLAQSIAGNRLRVRIYAHGRIHAKAYLFDRPGGPVALVGSSNISLPSPGNPTELNVVVRDGAAVAAVSDWFDDLWIAGHDFSRELFTQLSAAWPLSSG
jgi:phosphatidylserine/phosphatidylglycerophosphate/cardiolipin synthase-like enzyme